MNIDGVKPCAKGALDTEGDILGSGRRGSATLWGGVPEQLECAPKKKSENIAGPPIKCDPRGKKSLKGWQKSGRPAPIQPLTLTSFYLCFGTFFPNPI